MPRPGDVELGGGYFYRRYVGQSVLEPETGEPMEFWKAFDAGLPCGITLWRRRPPRDGDDDGDDAVGGVPFTGPKAWTVVQRDPLTLSPSLLCQPANVHGYIRDGRWIDA